MSSSNCKIKCIRDTTDQKFQCKIHSCPESEVINNEVIEQENDNTDKKEIILSKLSISLGIVIIIFIIYIIMKNKNK